MIKSPCDKKPHEKESMKHTDSGPCLFFPPLFFTLTLIPFYVTLPYISISAKCMCDSREAACDTRTPDLGNVINLGIHLCSLCDATPRGDSSICCASGTFSKHGTCTSAEI